MQMKQAGTRSNQSRTWFDEAFEATEFLHADHRDFAFPPHVHETFGIGVIEAGGGRCCVREPSLVMSAGTLCAINPGVVHEGRPLAPQGWRYRMFYPSRALIAHVLEDARTVPIGEWGLGRYVIEDRELYGEFTALHVSSELRESLLERESRTAVFVRRLFARYGNLSRERSRARVAPRTVSIVRDYLHAMAETQVGIADLARAAGVSGTQVIRSFSAGTGMPPHSYLVSLRVERAKVLLRSGRSPAETALKVGFSDQSQLTRHFKRVTGVNPGTIRR